MIDLMKDALENIIRDKRIRTVFQPIVSMRDLELLCRTTALEAAFIFMIPHTAKNSF